MAEPKTRPTDASVPAFLAAVPDAGKRDDATRVCRLMQEVTGSPPVMWGSGIVGFGRHRIEYATGRGLDWPVVGFSPRKASLVLYVLDGSEAFAPLLARLGKHTTGKACLYVKRLADVDFDVLRELVELSVARTTGAAGEAT